MPSRRANATHTSSPDGRHTAGCVRDAAACRGIFAGAVSGDLLFLEVKSSDDRRLFRRKVVKSNATEWIVSQLGVAAEDVPHELLDALRSTGESCKRPVRRIIPSPALLRALFLR